MKFFFKLKTLNLLETSSSKATLERRLSGSLHSDCRLLVSVMALRDGDGDGIRYLDFLPVPLEAVDLMPARRAVRMNVRLANPLKT